MRDKILWDSQQEGSIGGVTAYGLFCGVTCITYRTVRGTGDWQKRYWHCIRMPY